jgi:phosphonate transport system substrate-binding protein
MKRMLSWKVVFITGLLSLPHLTWAKPLNIGSISTEPAAEIKSFLPFASYLAKQLQSEGFDQGKVVVAKSMPEMATFLKEGKVDLYIDSPFPTMAVSRLSGSRLLLRRWKKGIGEYHSLIFTRTDSGINRLEDLKGKMLAFEEPFSSSGYFFPKMALMQEGLKLVAKKEPSDPLAAGEVGYVFSLEDENTMLWVLRGKVVAGAMDNQKYPNEARANLNSLKILYKTFSFPRQIVSHRADLPGNLVAKIKETLIKMDQSEEGKKVMQQFERTSKFDEIPEQSMAPLLKAGKFIDAEIGLR